MKIEVVVILLIQILSCGEGKKDRNTSLKQNTSPIAELGSSKISGETPLTVNFTSRKSSDDIYISKYSWKVDDSLISESSQTSYTFNDEGDYNVELIVEDEEGLNDSDTLQIRVNKRLEKKGESRPKAVISANVLMGEAPLELTFKGEKSFDDEHIEKYEWNFPAGTSSSKNITAIFTEVGVHNVILTVTDNKGLKDVETIEVTVQKPEIEQTQISCDEGGRKANETGRKIWCWKEVELPNYSNRTGVPFNDKQLNINSECYEKQVIKEGERLKFRVDPRNPSVKNLDWCKRDFNMRSEISVAPWKVNNPLGTEEWWGWSYTFGEDYKIDQLHPWLFFQVHHGVGGDSPQIELLVAKNGLYGAKAGEIIVKNNANNFENHLTGIVPIAGQTLDIVVHTIWGDASIGLFQVWINKVKVYDEKVRTVYKHAPWGGNAKWGVYKWPWRNEKGVLESEKQGITFLESYMGTLRALTRQPDNPEYGKNAFIEVMPQ